jgi:hypothetical protein
MTKDKHEEVMRMTRTRVFLLALALLSIAPPAYGQWYDEEEAPPGELQFLLPYTLKGYNLRSGADLSTWIAPGKNPKFTELGFVLRGSYGFQGAPLCFDLEVPISFLSGGSTDQFSVGDIGIGLRARLEPKFLGATVFTGLYLHVYVPNGGNLSTSPKILAAYGYGTMSNLIPGLFAPNSLTLSGGADILIPGEVFYFQFELGGAGYFPVFEPDASETTGAITWGAVFGIHILKEMAGILEFKGYTPVNATYADGTSAPSFTALSPGFRFDFGGFKPAIWVSIPLNEEYRNAFPDLIIGLSIAAFF